MNVQLTDPTSDDSTDAYVEAGSHVEVDEGALVVLDGVDGRRVALLSPGAWLSAQVED